MRVQPLFELIDVRVLVLDAPAHVDRRAQDGDAKGPVGLLDGDRVVVHAEVIGHKRLAEQGPLDRWQELELKELSVADSGRRPLP